MKTLRALLPSALLLAFLAPAPVHALGSINFGIQCTPGPFRACAAVEIWNEVDPVTNDFYLHVQIANLQGSPGFEDLPIMGIVSWSFSNLALNCTPTHIYPDCDEDDVRGRITDFGIAGDDFAFQDDEGLYTAGFSHFQNSDDRLWGCDPPPDFLLSSHINCGGFYHFRTHLGFGSGFQITSRTTLNLGFLGASEDYSSEHASACSTDPSEGFAEGSVTLNECESVPEPSAPLLLATGMLGLLGLARRRRSSTDAP